MSEKNTNDPGQNTDYGIRSSEPNQTVQPATFDINMMCRNAVELIRYARTLAVRQINLLEILTNYALGYWIVTEQQQGVDRAQYGAQVIDRLAEALTEEFGRGYSRESLRNARKFYLVFHDRISQTLFTKFTAEKSQTLFGELEEAPFSLSWSHYLILMRIKDEKERAFYEKEAGSNGWDVRTLQRQYASSLYERLLLSSDKDKASTLWSEGHTVEKAEDIVKDPMVLEFLGLPETAAVSETDLETRLIDHLQDFIMELGKGFTFVARQKRFTFDEDTFRVDLVMYNRLLRCFVLFDLKVEKLTHRDLGQMQMYVNYYDRYEKTEDERPTVGILLCKDKNDAMVELTLPKEANIYASQYQLYLPDKKLLQKKLEQWLLEEKETSNPLGCQGT